jgi:hypothetical protein
VGDARIVVGEDCGEGEIGRERRRRAGALRVVQRQVETRAVLVREICKRICQSWPPGRVTRSIFFI